MSYIVDRKNETFFVYTFKEQPFFTILNSPFCWSRINKESRQQSLDCSSLCISVFSPPRPPILDTLQGVLIVTDHKLKAWVVALQGGQAKTSNGTAKS